MKKDENREYYKGAKNLLESLNLKSNDGLIIMSSEDNLKFSSIIIEVAKYKGFKNILYILIPDILRPISKIPEVLYNVINNSKALIVNINRLSEETFTFIRPLSDLCNKKKVKHLLSYEPKLKYLKEGIAADYMAIEKKTKNLKEILEESENIEVISEFGTSLKFKIYKDIAARSPLFESGQYINQAPEGEVMACPVEETFNGKLVADGTITGMGKPPEPIEWEFKNGQVTKVKGNEEFIAKLLSMIQRADKRVRTLKGVWIAEFALGTNDRAEYDDNLSNCEKVSGGIHVAVGKTCGVTVGRFLGKDRGETFHIDNILTNCTVTVNKKNGEKVIIIKSGKLII